MLLWRLIFHVRSRLSEQEQRTSWQYKMACILLHYQVQIPEIFRRSGRRGRIFFGAIVRICSLAETDMWAKGWGGSPVHLKKLIFYSYLIQKT